MATSGVAWQVEGGDKWQAHLAPMGVATEDQVDVGFGGNPPDLGMLLPIQNIGFSGFIKRRIQETPLHNILDILHLRNRPQPKTTSTKVSSSQSLPSVAANRRIEPAKLGSMIRGELDWIVMKALEKDRTRRYETANGFAEDIQRYLNDRCTN